MVDIAKEIVMRSFLVDGTLYIRTHAHSLHDSYFFDVRTPIFPHQHPGVQNLYCSLFDAAASAGCAVEFLTASEVYERFVTAEFMPESGRDLVIPGAPSEVEGIVPGPEPERRLVEPTVVVLTEMPLRRSLPKPMFELLSSPVSDGAPLSDTSAVALVVKTEPAPPLRTAAKPDLLRANKKPPTPEKFSNKMSQPVVREWEVANAEACSVTRNRLQALGEVDSGASSFYAVRLERNAIVTKYEIEIVRYLISAPERYDTYFEIGCGAAVLTAILAINGLPAVGIEGDRKRFQLGEAILTSIKQVDETMVSARCEIVFGRFPSILDAVSVAKSIAIVTNVSATMTEEQRLAFIHGLARFRAVIIDVQHFLSARKAPAEQQALIQELAEFGITNPRLLGGMPSYGPFYMFDGLPAKLAEHQERLEPVAAL